MANHATSTGVSGNSPTPFPTLPPALFEPRLNLPGHRRGKVRDLYTLEPHHETGAGLLIIASDRISAFDVVLPTPLPGKGVLLTKIAAWWLKFIEKNGLCKTHLVSTAVQDLPDSAFADNTSTRNDLAGRCTIAKPCQVIPIEFVVRGYIEGSGWKDYQQTGTICSVKLPQGLKRCQKLPEPIFTPATKAEFGEHDENISFEQACDLVGSDLMKHLRDVSINIYQTACTHALARGIIIADTKFEFGFELDSNGKIADETPILIDEALTPDSSRFWPAAQYAPGQSQPSFDKQFVREYLESLVQNGQWDKTSPGPELPEQVVRQTLEKYQQAAELLTGES